MTTLDPPAEKNGTNHGQHLQVHAQVDDRLQKQRCKNAYTDVAAQSVPALQRRRQRAQAHPQQQRQYRRRAHKAQHVGQVRKDKVVPGVGHKDVLRREQPRTGQPAGADGHRALVLLVGNVGKARVIRRNDGQNALELVAF